jgi:hypothetical protein
MATIASGSSRTVQIWAPDQLIAFARCGLKVGEPDNSCVLGHRKPSK